MNNFEKIKQMNIKELVCFLDETPCYHCVNHKKNSCHIKNRTCQDGIKQWLLHEVENE